MKKILVIRLSSIGDIVLTTPVFRCLRKQFPEAEIHWLTKEQYVPVLLANPNITKIHSFSRKLSEVLPALKAEKFDHVVDLHKNIRSVTTLLTLQRPSTTFPKLNFRKFLLTTIGINLLPPIHIVDRYFKAVEPLGVKNDGQGLDFFIPGETEENETQVPETFRQGYIAWVIGGKFGTKIYPEDKIIRICKSLKSPIILLGGKEDASRGERISNACGTNVFNGCGKMTLFGSAYAVKKASGVITNDTGLMHIAAAFRKPILSLWGNTVPGFGMYPYLPPADIAQSTILEVKGLSCRPCSKIGFSKCPRGHFDCMNKLPEDTIITWAKSQVSQVRNIL